MEGKDQAEAELDEARAQEMAEQLVHVQESSSGKSTELKQRRAMLLQWMIDNDRTQIDVGAGSAEVHYSSKALKTEDVLYAVLRDDPYNWQETQIDELIERLRSAKEHLADTKAVLRVRLKRRNGPKKKAAKHASAAAEGDDDGDGAGAEGDVEGAAGEGALPAKRRSPDAAYGSDDGANSGFDGEKKSRRSDSNVDQDIKHAPVGGIGTEAPPGGVAVHEDQQQPEAPVKKAKRHRGNANGGSGSAYDRDMDLEDVSHGRSKPVHEFADGLGPLRINA